jgi:hypothetical protein
MRKLRLDAETLAVDSFPTVAAGDARQGTVLGAESTYLSRCGTCWGVTCAPMCGGRDEAVP